MRAIFAIFWLFVIPILSYYTMVIGWGVTPHNVPVIILSYVVLILGQTIIEIMKRD